MEKKTLAIILIGTAVVIGGGTTVYIVGKKKGWFGEKPDENDPLAENGSSNAVTTGNNNGGGAVVTTNSGTTTQQASNTVWDAVYLPNKDQNISDISKDAKKLLQYTINEVYAGSSKIKIDGAVGPATRVSFYYCLKAMYPATFKDNPFDLEKTGGIKTIMQNYKFSTFIDSACRYLAGDRKMLKPISTSEIQNMVNNVPKSAIGLSGLFNLTLLGLA